MADALSASSCDSQCTQCTQRGREKLPHVGGQGQWVRVPGCDSTGTAERSHLTLRSGVAARRSHPTSEVRGNGLEEAPHV